MPKEMLSVVYSTHYRLGGLSLAGMLHIYAESARCSKAEVFKRPGFGPGEAPSHFGEPSILRPSDG